MKIFFPFDGNFRILTIIVSCKTRFHSLVAPAPIVEPLFVTVPPRPQRVLHSEAYIK